MTDNQLRRCILVLGLLLTAAAAVPSAGAQGLSGAETTAINNLLGAGVLGAALPARSPIAVWCEGVSGALSGNAVDMTLRLDDAAASPTCPLRQQQQQTTCAA